MDKAANEVLQAGELQAMTNALNSLGLDGYRVYIDHSRRERKYFLMSARGDSLTG